MKKIVQIIFENDKGEFLFYLRDGKPGIPFPHHWDLIGGHIEKDEIPDLKFANILKSIVLDYIEEQNP
jgi:8-oxo-dGTP pyrophosphatase MutT (NUDIX family)